jgi:membrane protease YdiL (CAAX protease family)
MKTILQKTKSNLFFSVLFAIAIGLVVLFLSKYLNNILKHNVFENLELNFYSSNVIYKLLLLLFSILAIFILKTDSLKEFGFRASEKIKVGRFLLISIGIIIGSFIIGNIIFNGILRTAFPVEGGGQGFPKSTVIQTILTVWIWSSICEEVLTRGLVQGIMNSHTKIKFIRLSVPVWISGLFFGAMHLSLLKTDMDIWFVSFIVFNTTVLGLLAAFYREKTKSIYPAIFLHFLANVIGSLPAMILGLI